MTVDALGRERSGWRRGQGGGALILLLLIGVALILVLMFGNFGGQSYMQNVAGAKKKGDTLGVQLVADQLMNMVVEYKLSNNDKLPQSYADMQTSPDNFLDPWKKPVRFKFDTSGGTTKLIVISDGPDGQPDTEDDIKVEKPLPV